MKRTLRLLSAFLLIGVLSSNSFAITFFPQEFTCPIDGQKNTFQVVGSYGSYIYSDPSKYQWLFFPQTSSTTYYICKKCHYTAYSWDFDKLPKEKIAAVKKVLAGVKFSMAFDDYLKAPLEERLEIMEKVYGVLDKDDVWWERFYRTKGFFYHIMGSTEKAAEARRKSLDLVQKELKNEKSETSKKLLYYVSAAMKHFLNDDKGALEDLQKALETKYAEKNATPEQINNAEQGLNGRIEDYVARIKSPSNKPRDVKDEH